MPDSIDVIQSRRSIRRFTDKAVIHEDLTRILETAGTAPSGGNLQPWHFIVVQNKEIINQMENIIRDGIDNIPGILERYPQYTETEIVKYHKKWKSSSLFFPKAPVTIAVLAKNIPELYEPYAQHLAEKGFETHEARHYMGLVEIMSVSAAVENLLIAAHSLGYGACWMRVPFMVKDELKGLLKIHSPWDLMTLIPVGHPDPAYSPPKRIRKKLQEIVTFY